MTGPLDGRTALILGANGGIGQAIAHALGTAGARLVLAARDRGGLGQLRSERVLHVTLRGTLVAMRHELAVLPDGGNLVNVVSTAGVAAAPGMAAYVAAKHGVVGLTRTAALDYAGRGIRVNAVAPGSMDSGGITAQPDEIKQHIGSDAPLGRLGSPDEVAAAVTWLASPAASYTTGAILTVDGGKGAPAEPDPSTADRAGERP